MFSTFFSSGSKALEKEVLAGAGIFFVWRLRIPFDHESSPWNYLQKLLNNKNLPETENSVSLFEKFCKKCVEFFTNVMDLWAYNMTNSGSITTRQVTGEMAQEGLTDKKFKFFNSEEEEFYVEGYDCSPIQLFSWYEQAFKSGNLICTLPRIINPSHF